MSTISFARAKLHFENSVQAAHTATRAVTIWPQNGQRKYEVQATPKEQLAALRAAVQLMSEAATTSDEQRQVLYAQREMESFRGIPHSNILAAAVDALHMKGRTKRIKNEMVKVKLEKATTDDVAKNKNGDQPVLILGDFSVGWNWKTPATKVMMGRTFLFT
jgi:hypothetical protein